MDHKSSYFSGDPTLNGVVIAEAKVHLVFLCVCVVLPFFVGLLLPFNFLQVYLHTYAFMPSSLKRSEEQN